MASKGSILVVAEAASDPKGVAEEAAIAYKAIESVMALTAPTGSIALSTQRSI